MSQYPFEPVQMSNSHLLVNEFDYYEPSTLAEASTLLQQFGDNAQLVAGGTNVIVSMKMEKEAPQVLVSLARIPGLSGIRLTPEGGLEIGALTPIHTVRLDPLVLARYPALAQACAAFGSLQIELMGTIGGNLCNGSPASDTVPALLALDASLRIHGPTGERILPAEQFLLGPGKVDLQPGEILTTLILPATMQASLSAYFKISRVAADLAKASLAILLVRDGERIAECRLAFGSVAPTVLRARKAEALLEGQQFTPELVARVSQVVGEEVSPIDDVRSTAWYRRQIVGVMAHDAITRVWEQSGRSSTSQAGPTQPDGHPARQVENFSLPSRQVKKEERAPITLTVNGVERRLDVASNELLLNVLRERLQLTGSKYGCGLGECSACTIHLDGQPALACLVLAVAADGKRVETIEGLQQPDGSLDPLQEAFIDQAAFQCGYCTPGIIMTAKGLLIEKPVPGEDDIRDYLKGNRCRCTGYISIVRAVLATVKEVEHAG